MHAVRVALVKQALLEEGGGAVRDDAVALHLSKPQPTVAGTALHWLPRQDLDRAAAPEKAKQVGGRRCCPQQLLVRARRLGLLPSPAPTSHIPLHLEWILSSTMCFSR